MTKITHDQINQMTLAQLRALISDAVIPDLATTPQQTEAAINLYVNPGAAYDSWGAGSDANAGTQAAPFATPQAAIESVPKCLLHDVTMHLAGTPHYYEWKPDGTNGIRFTTGDESITVAVEAGSSLAVAISGTAVTVTLATGGSTITQIIAAINASATVGPVIFPIAVGTASTNITATLSATALSGGNVRTYTGVLSIYGLVGAGQVIITNDYGATNYGCRFVGDRSATSSRVIRVFCTTVSVTVNYVFIKTTASGATSAGLAGERANYALFYYCAVVGAFGYGAIRAEACAVFARGCLVYNSTVAEYSVIGGDLTTLLCGGSGNTTVLLANSGFIHKNGAVGIAGTTAETIIGGGQIL